MSNYPFYITGYLKDSEILPEPSETEKLTGTLNVAAMPEPKLSEYSGELEIEPKKSEQVLNTRGKVFTENLTVKGISYHEETDSAGGTILTIGRD